MDYCPECGEEVGGTETYCPECGEEITAASPDQKRQGDEEQDKTAWRAVKIIGGITIVVLVLGTLFGGGGTPSTDDPLTQMSVVFEGDYSRSEIKDVVDASLGTFDIPVNDANRRDAGDLALNLAEDSDKTKMEIIGCVSMTGPGEGEEYEDMTKWENYEVVAAGCAISN